MYEFHSVIAEAYKEVHIWLDEVAPGYRQDSGNVRTKPTKKNTAAQFDKYLHAHLFKVQRVLEQQIDDGTLEFLVNTEDPLIYIDIACGSGTSSIALINTILQTKKLRSEGPIEIFFIGLDIDRFALKIYTQFMSRISEEIDTSRLVIDFKCVHIGVPEGITEVIGHIKDRWRKPTPIPHAILTQINAVRPFKEIDDIEHRIRSELIDNKIPIAEIIEEQFTRRIVNSYRQLLVDANIDNLTFILIGTDEMKWGKSLQNFAKIAEQQFQETNIKLETLCMTPVSDPINIRYRNPDGTSWYPKYRDYSTNFYTYAAVATNVKLISDDEWSSLTSIENLRLAWVRSRHYMLRESLVDEFEIRLFDADLDSSLQNLRRKLILYLKDLAETFSRLGYNFPKKWNTEQVDVIPRPRVLTRFEEDILAVAIVQVIGSNITEIETSYEYKLQSPNNTDRTEYLYQYYLNGYRDFIEHARHEVERLAKALNAHKALVVQTDIESFYTNIEQSALVSKIPTTSDRLSWLLSEILQKPIPETAHIPEENRHKPGYGLIQGGTASGYFAKLYLRSLHNPINDGRTKLFRYADDIILTIPPTFDADKTLKTLEERLQILGLSLSSEKTKMAKPDEFLNNLKSQDDLDDWDSHIKGDILRPLYATCGTYRRFFDRHNDEGTWYSAIEWYQKCLQKIGVYFTEAYLSRKIQENLNPRNVSLRNFPDPHTYFNSPVEEWAHEFHRLNQNWVESTLTEIRNNVQREFLMSWTNYKEAEKDDLNRRWHLARVRFFAGKLVYLGFGSSIGSVIDALHEPGVFPNPRWIIESLMLQGIHLEFIDLLNELKARSRIGDDYMRAICARAIRFLPYDFHEAFDESVGDFLSSLIHNGTIIEKLMATETLIFIERRLESIEYCSFIELLQNEEILCFPQVIRNITMVVAIYCDTYLRVLEKMTHPVIKDTLQINRYELGFIIRRPEPNLIREYYNSVYPDIDDLGAY